MGREAESELEVSQRGLDMQPNRGILARLKKARHCLSGHCLRCVYCSGLPKRRQRSRPSSGRNGSQTIGRVDKRV